MMKRAKFNQDSVDHYQRHTEAVRQYLNTGPRLVPPPAPKVKTKAPRKRRESTFYRRLAWIARGFPLAIAFTCLFILWDSQQREAFQFQPVSEARQTLSATPIRRPASASARTGFDLSLAQTMDVGPEHPARSGRALTPSHAILLRDPVRMSARADENATMGALPTR